MKKWKKIMGTIALSLILAMVLASCTNDDQEVKAPEDRASVGLEEFEAETLTGEVINQDIFKDADLTMINVWATYCGYCINEMPDLGDMAEEYKDQGFQVLGIAVDVTSYNLSTAEEIIEETGANYRHLYTNVDLDRIFLRDIQAVPTTVFVDKNGKKVGRTISGSRSGEDWRLIVEDLLSKV